MQSGVLQFLAVAQTSGSGACSSNKPPSELFATRSVNVCLHVCCVHKQVNGMNFGELRDKLLHVAPLDTAWVKRVNTAEAQFWKLCAGKRSGQIKSNQLLGCTCSL